MFSHSINIIQFIMTTHRQYAAAFSRKLIEGLVPSFSVGLGPFVAPEITPTPTTETDSLNRRIERYIYENLRKNEQLKNIDGINLRYENKEELYPSNQKKMVETNSSWLKKEFISIFC